MTTSDIAALRGLAEPKRIMQTEFGPTGNCQSACLAMMLGIELSEVPSFNALYGKDPNEYTAQIAKWLAERGLWSISFVPWQGVPWPPQHGYYIAGGTSPRGIRHAVIYKDGELWHDPAPEGGGIESVTDIDLILPLGFCPALPTRDDLLSSKEAAEQKVAAFKEAYKRANVYRGSKDRNGIFLIMALNEIASVIEDPEPEIEDWRTQSGSEYS